FNHRFGYEIVGDSLDVVEYVMELEQALDVTIQDKVIGSWFSRPLTLGEFIARLRTLPRTGSPARTSWGRPREPWVEALPVTQEGGALAEKEWRQGPLYEPTGSNREGFPQYRRLTDGMRCVLLPGGQAVLGSDEPDALPDQRPAHAAAINP